MNHASGGDKISTTVLIEKMVAGGHALARIDTEVVFVDGVVPGERAVIEQAGTHGGARICRPLEIVKSSPHRREPMCPFFGECGGCNWQHIAYPQQLQYKHDIFIECLKRTGKINSIPTVNLYPSPPEQYRFRVQIKIDHQSGAAGFFKRKTNSVVAIPRCPLLLAPLNDFLHTLGTRTDCIPRHYNVVRALAGDNHRVASFPVIENETVPSTTVTVAGKPLTVKGEDFFQSNRPLIDTFADWVADYAEGETFVDMYGGIGLFSVLVGNKFTRGVCVEESVDHTKQAARNLSANDMNHITTHAVRAEQFLRSSPLSSTDCLIVDPPRPGLTRQVREGIGRLRPRTVIYVSCNAVTQARDAGYLCNKCGYRIKKAALFDFYPQTHHFETVLVLSR
jgi:23S rRNA (uracil1939-C5)-methyltransferase